MKRIQTPFFLFLVTAVLISISELGTIYLLRQLGELTLPEEVIFSALILSIIAFPLLFLFLFDPMLRYSEERERAVSELEKVQDSLEFQVRERTRRLLELNEELKADISRREKAEHELAQSEHYLKTIFESEPQSVAIIDRTGLIHDINPAGAIMLEAENRKKLIGMSYLDLTVNHQRDLVLHAIQRACNGERSDIDHEAKTLKERERTFSSHLVPLRDQQAGTNRSLVISRDVTEHKKLEAQFMHAQKMEALGRVAGGVAHDFNNILTSIMGNAEIILEKVEPGSDLHDSAETVLEAGKRASRLTRQLLAFSKKQLFNIELVDLDKIILEIRKMLDRVMGENIEVEISLSSQDAKVKADVGQLEQVIMNLAVNALDAMPQCGKLRFSTHVAELDASYSSGHLEVEPGTYCMLSISDTGMGIPRSALDHIFDPFFTTKESGTGLGLSTVYGIMKQLGGNISVYSEPGEGTTFKLLFPVVKSSASDVVVEGTAGQKQQEHIFSAAGAGQALDGAAQAGTAAPDESSSPGANSHTLLNEDEPGNAITELGGTETIMVVEDDGGIRELVSNTLRVNGYTVFEFKDGNEAVAFLEERARRTGSSSDDFEPDLLLTDVVLPGFRGPEVAAVVQSTYPTTQVIYMSGYTDERVHDLVQSTGSFNFVAKPFTPRELLYRLRTALDKSKT